MQTLEHIVLTVVIQLRRAKPSSVANTRTECQAASKDMENLKIIFLAFFCKNYLYTIPGICGHLLQDLHDYTFCSETKK